ncbi:hypothetical protein GCM10020220_084920 [Nonomuraea rubra]|uniref:Uma2 family endonuclease n=1 Tax=Nonomuraea rubra TaxID=46180 RepID=UPI0031F0D02E
MAAEIVSPSSIHTDRVAKLHLYALGKIPVYLLIDPIAQPPVVTRLQQPSRRRIPHGHLRGDGEGHLPALAHRLRARHLHDQGVSFSSAFAIRFSDTGVGVPSV